MRIKMEQKNILNITTREDFRKWLIQNHNTESECWMAAKRGKNSPTDCVWYLDAVEEVLCFGWIDTTHKKIDGVDMQRFTPVIDTEIQKAFWENPLAWKNFQSFPALYQRVRIDSIQRDKKKDREIFEIRLKKLVEQSEAGKMFGDWNDYGRLLDY